MLCCKVALRKGTWSDSYMDERLENPRGGEGLGERETKMLMCGVQNLSSGKERDLVTIHQRVKADRWR